MPIIANYIVLQVSMHICIISYISYIISLLLFYHFEYRYCALEKKSIQVIKPSDTYWYTVPYSMPKHRCASSSLMFQPHRPCHRLHVWNVDGP